MHSLVVKKNDGTYSSVEILDKIWLYDDEETGEKKCVWDIYREEELSFGRSPFRALGTFREKWLYTCASLVSEYNDDTYKELEALAFKYVPGLKKINMPMERMTVPNKDDESYKDNDYVQKYGKTEDELVAYLTQKEKDWGIEEIEYFLNRYGEWQYNKPYTGYVDEDILSGFLKQEGITLEEFITNKKYIVVQDGDEYEYYRDMKRCGLINLDAIDHEYPERNDDE
jgi:hypothetical protein